MERSTINFGGIRFSPTCKGGLLSVQYYLKIKFKIDSIFSKDEKIKIQLDLYTPNNHNKNDNNSNLNLPCTNDNKDQIDCHQESKERNILNNNNINNNKNLMKNPQKIKGNLFDNYKNININNKVIKIIILI